MTYIFLHQYIILTYLYRFICTIMKQDEYFS